MARWWHGLVALLVLALLPARAIAQQGIPATENPGRNLLPPERIAALPAAERAAWTAYIDESRRLHASDSVAMASELRKEARTEMMKAPYMAPDFNFQDRDDAWIRSDSALSVADAVVSFQTRSGGWSKRTDMRRNRLPGMSYYSETDAWHYIPTFDNGATTGQLRFLARVGAVRHEESHRAAWRRGIALLLAAQQPSGCWPQSYPLEGGYHDAITFNDDATILILRTLDDVAKGAVPFASGEERSRAAAAARRGVACLLAIQVVVNGTPTVWGQQHDPITLEIVPARSYELAGLAGRESASVMMYLMSIPNPDVKVIAAVNAAAEWFRRNAITGHAYDYKAGLHVDPNGGPLWARITEISTGRPIFSNRDGIKLYDSDKLTDRHSGYGWFSGEPASVLKKYDRWSQSHNADSTR